MQIKNITLSLALAAVAAAQGNVQFTSVPTDVEPGQPVTVTYEGNPNEPATIILRKGDPGNLETIETITTTATGGSFQWTPPSEGAEDYALEIRQGGTSNYSGMIAVSGESNPASAVTAAVASAASSAISSVASSVSGSASSVASSVSASASSAASSASESLLSSASAVSSSASEAVSSIVASVSSALNSTIPTTVVASVGTGTAMTRNTTMSSATLTSTATETESETDTATATSEETETGTSTATGTSAPNSNSAAGLSSPLALVLGAVAAMIYLN